MFKVFITGVGTEIGKTYLGVQLIKYLKNKDLIVAAKKPLQSFEPTDFGLEKTDGHLLGKQTGQNIEDVVLESFEVPLAPVMAAEVLDKKCPGIQEVHRFCLNTGEDANVVLTEGAGGLLSPLTEDGSNLDLIKAINPDLVVVVTEAALGMINLVRMTMGFLTDFAAVVYVNRYEEEKLEKRLSVKWLKSIDKFMLFNTVDELGSFIAKQLI